MLTLASSSLAVPALTAASTNPFDVNGNFYVNLRSLAARTR